MNSFASQFKLLLAGLSSSLHGLRNSIAGYYATPSQMTPSRIHQLLDSRTATVHGCALPADEHGYDSPPCGNRTQYWFWDQEFPTERAAKITAAAFYQARFIVPVNLKKSIDGN